MSATILRLGWSDPQSDVFGAHPTLGPVLDLNDGVTFTLLGPDAMDLAPPPRTLVLSGNMRSHGERGILARFRQNRHVTARVTLGPMASFADLSANLRALVAWLDAPPSLAVALQYQPPGASAPVYLDVVGCAHDIPAEEADWLRLELEPVELVFVCRPGMRGDRVTLQNLVSNPGFEAPSGPAITAFSDSCATSDAYATLSGTPPAAAANVLYLATNTTISFGSPAWGAIACWQLRFQPSSSSGSYYFYLHYADANDGLRVDVNTTEQFLVHNVAGTAHILATGNASIVTAAWYWLTITQFPSVPGNPPQVQATLRADSGGAPGAILWSLGPVPTYDAVTALSGRPAIVTTSQQLAVGGAYAGVQVMQLFGPGGWAWLATQNGATGVAAGAWEQSATNTYAGGPVTSFAAARVDFPPAGSVDCAWRLYAGGADAGTSAMPLRAAGDTLQASVWARSTGLSPTAFLDLTLTEYDGNGDALRSTTIATLAGNQPAWTQLAGSVATGATTAYADLMLRCGDAAPGASAGATVWYDNAQCWNASATGASTMPYCELRFPQAPAQLVVSGLIGDLPAPAFLALGTYLTSWPTGATLTLALGRRGSVSAAARLVGPSYGNDAPGVTPPSTYVLDPASYGGYCIQAQVTSAGWNPRGFSLLPADAPGTYHLWGRLLTQQATANLGNVQVRAVTAQQSDAWFGESSGADTLGSYYGPYAQPFGAGASWTLADAGQVALPPFAQGPLTDPMATSLTPRCQLVDNTAGGSVCQAGWQALLPVDGALLLGGLNNPSNAPFSVSGQWLWAYVDGLGITRGQPAAWTYSLEAQPLANPARGAGGPGTSTTGAINLNAGADPALTLDPTQQLAGAGGTNQLVAIVADGAGAVLPLCVEISYTPLYLWPR